MWCWSKTVSNSVSSSTAHKAQQEKSCSEIDTGNNCEKVSAVLSWFVSAHCLSTPSVMFLLFAAYHDDPVLLLLFFSSFLFLSQGNDQLQNGDSNSRYASLSEEEENLAVLRRWGIGDSSFICNQITQQMDCGKMVSLFIVLGFYLCWIH